MGMEAYLLPMVILLLVLVVTLISIDSKLSRQIKQNKDIEDALYRLIEITKQKSQ
ncbi:hypothetical protein [Paenibacillus thalictri]|uniref:hypothetical protein n=1 Tax=Paenibacillus thalictri TaxID=2527873 RepID=UPI0013EF30BA|nr:hypothetical protein [Paenibacillus thalictri]